MEQDMSTTNTGCPSTWQLERFHFGFASGKERQEVKEHLSTCRTCQQHIHAFQYDELGEALPSLSWDDEVEAAPLFPELLAPAAPQDPPAPPFRSWWQQWQQLWAPGFAVAALAGLYFFINVPKQIQHMPSAPNDAGHPGIRIKGGDEGQLTGYSLYIRRHQNGKIIVAKEHQDVHTKDTLRFGMRLRRSMYIMVLSVNSRGEVSQYYPYPSPEATLMSEGKHTFPKDNAIPLDSYVGEELFVIIGRGRAFSRDEAKTALKGAYQEAKGQLSKLKTPKGFSWFMKHPIQKVSQKASQP